MVPLLVAWALWLLEPQVAQASSQRRVEHLVGGRGHKEGDDAGLLSKELRHRRPDEGGDDGRRENASDGVRHDRLIERGSRCWDTLKLVRHS